MIPVVVEHRFHPPLNLSRGLPTPSTLGGPCLSLYEVSWESTYFSSDGTRDISVHEAPDAELVRRAYRAAGAAFRGRLVRPV
jgi:hypothetical protein